MPRFDTIENVNSFGWKTQDRDGSRLLDSCEIYKPYSKRVHICKLNRCLSAIARALVDQRSKKNAESTESRGHSKLRLLTQCPTSSSSVDLWVVPVV